jgi:DNA-binding NarL/FixJ family response regulator
MKILIVDDHVLIRDALHAVLKDLKPDATIAEAASSREAMQFLEQNPGLHLVVLDLNLPDRDGLALLGDLRGRYADVSVVVLSAHSDREIVRKSLELGALGFIPKSSPRGVMLSAFSLMFSGGVYIPPEILPGMNALAPRPRDLQSSRPKFSDLGLTDRQVDVLTLMMQGKSNKAICRALKLAEPTVKSHVAAILKSLNCANRTEAVAVALNISSTEIGSTQFR